MCPGRLSPYPAEHLLVLHQALLPEAARDVQDVELRRILERRIGRPFTSWTEWTVLP